MQIKIVKTFSDVEPYLSQVQTSADENRNALGFLPKSAYQELALQEKLWISTCIETGKYFGHLMFGGKYPFLKIFQLYVCPDTRKLRVASHLIEELIQHGEVHSYQAISARVAADLAANSFWDKAGFKLIRQKAGGGSRNRTINIREKALNTPTLFKYTHPGHSESHSFDQGICYNRPISNSPSYVLDLNIFYDVVNKRPRAKEASQLIQAGFNSQVSLCVTSEFTKELERTSTKDKRDPILEFAKHLPTLPIINEKDVPQLLAELRMMVFPQRTPNNKKAENDKSDLMHLASCIHHKVYGFVTREKAILKAGDDIRQTYGLDVVSPTDFVNSSYSGEVANQNINITFQDEALNLSVAKESERECIEKFLINMGVSVSQIATVWSPGTSGFERNRICAWSGHDLIGIASWDVPNKFTKETVLNVFVNEEHPAAIRIIDHILESVSRNASPFHLRRISLTIGPEQKHTRRTALERGFRQSAFGEQEALTKISYAGYITPESWSDFLEQFREITDLCLPNKMPTYEEFLNTGVQIESSDHSRITHLKLFDFETLISPAIVLCSKRSAVLLPIRSRYADDLLSNVRKQQCLFPTKEALLHTEKAYFKSTRNASLFEKGLPVVFYISGPGGGDKEAVGIGRITFSDTMTIDEVKMNLSRQGVLSDEELSEKANSGGILHVSTFDNFNLFPNPIAYKMLKEMNCISGANLVTAEKLLPAGIKRLCETAFTKEISA